MSAFDICRNGDCNPTTCPACVNRCDACGLWIGACQCATWGERLERDKEPSYGMCTNCGAVEVALNTVTGTRDLSAVGESSKYPTGYGCEVCS